jgi:hypothetical protein
MSDREWLVPVSVIVSVEMLLWVIAFLAGTAYAPLFTTYGLLAVVFFAIFIGVRVFAVVVVLQREGEPRLLKRLAELAYENRARLLSTIVGLQLLSLGSAAFAALKGGIPKTSPFWLDVPLANAEQRVFGVEPWQITHALLGWATPLIDHIYATFVAVHLLTVFTLIASPPSRLKGRALVCLSLCWIVLGIGAAYLLSSAGPLFYDRIFDSHRFAALNDVIRARAPLSQIVVDALWSAYKSDRGFIANGISAMPSMHVALTLWLALIVKHTRAAPIAWAYYIIIWIGSVHLGWHYFSDGLVASIGVVALWKLSPRLLFRPASIAEPVPVAAA